MDSNNICLNQWMIEWMIPLTAMREKEKCQYTVEAVNEKPLYVNMRLTVMNWTIL